MTLQLKAGKYYIRRDLKKIRISANVFGGQENYPFMDVDSTATYAEDGRYNIHKSRPSYLDIVQEAKEEETLQQFCKKYSNKDCRMDLIPLCAVKEVSKVLHFGCQKYSENGWKELFKKDPQKTAKERHASLLRHLEEFQRGVVEDEESGLDPLAHLACNALFLLWARGQGLI